MQIRGALLLLFCSIILLRPAAGLADSKLKGVPFSINWGDGWEVTERPSTFDSANGIITVRAVRTIDEDIRGVLFLSSVPHQLERAEFQALKESDIIQILEKKLVELRNGFMASKGSLSVLSGLSDIKRIKVSEFFALQTESVLLHENDKVWQQFVVVIGSNYLYRFTFIAPEPHLPRLRPEFEKVLHGITLR